MEWYLEALRKYADFSGRARRKEYWMFSLLNAITQVGIIVVADLVSSAVVVAFYLYALAMVIPALAVAVRRLHDTGRSGWWLLIAAIPLVNLLLLFFMIEDGNPGPNKYGADPKGARHTGHLSGAPAV